jgi:signal peptidase I
MNVMTAGADHAKCLGSVQSLLCTVVIAIFVITFLVQAFQIPSESMENTLLIGDYLLVDKVHYASAGLLGDLLPYRSILRSDIIVFHYPVHPEQHFVKRVIGLPGDRIHIRGTQVWVNGTPLRETYALYRAPSEDGYHYKFPSTDFIAAGVEARWWLEMRERLQGADLVVPAGDYFVLGDNRDQSLDSRFWGFVPRENIIGRPLIIYWSVQGPKRSTQLAASQGDKLSHFTYLLTHIVQATRWDRTFRLVN